MTEFPFHTVDMVLLAFLIGSALIGFSRGFIREIAGILSFLLALGVAIFIFPDAKEFVSKYVSMPVLASTLALIGLFLGTLILSRWVLGSLRSKAAEVQLSGLDQAMGFLFGGLRAFIIACLVLIIIDWLIPLEKQPDWLAKFQSRPLLESGISTLEEVIPTKTKENLAPDVEAMGQFGIAVKDAVKSLFDPKNWRSKADKEQSEDQKKDKTPKDSSEHTKPEENSSSSTEL